MRTTDDYTNAADTELTAACLKGESRAWEELIERYKRLIYSIPCKYHLSPDEAADVFQTVCVTLLQNLGSLRDNSKLSSWLITITTRECWKAKKRQDQQATDWEDEQNGMDQIPDQQQLPDEAIQTLQEQQLVRQAIRQLDQRCNSLLSQLFYENRGQSYQQISEKIGIPVASIGPTRGRCLKKLKRMLEKLGFSG